MTSYFDTATHAVHTIKYNDMTDDLYLSLIASIEKPVVEAVLLNTGDREFPEDLREKILGIIATKAIYQVGLQPTKDAVRYTLAVRSSELLSSLHSAFHTLAGRRIKARFGFWSDSPSQNLVSRRDHDDPASEEEDE